LFSRFTHQESIDIIDRQVDYFGLRDFLQVVDYYLNINNEPMKDVNCVYQDKNTVSELLDMFRNAHGVTTTVNIQSVSKMNYTGNGNKLAVLGLPLIGIEESIKNYFTEF
jgi:hypothetical protein